MTIIFNISHFSKPRSYPLPPGLTVRYDSPRLMGVQQSAMPPCFGALHCAVVQGAGSLSRPGRGGKAGERASNPEVSVVGFR